MNFILFLETLFQTLLASLAFMRNETFSAVLAFMRNETFSAVFKQCAVDSFFEIACSLIGSIFTVYVVLCTLFHFRFLLIASTNGTP